MRTKPSVSPLRWGAAVFASLLLLACGSSEDTALPGGLGTADAAGDDAARTLDGYADVIRPSLDPGTGGTGSTDRGSTPGVDPGPAGVDTTGSSAPPRIVVVSRTYREGGARADYWDLLELTVEGEVKVVGPPFEMGRASSGRVVFVAGGVGAAALDEGGLGVFRISADGKPHVLRDGYKPDFYAGSVAPALDGKTIWVIDSEWENLGGGIHGVTVDAQDKLGYLGRLLAAKLPYALARVPGPYERVLLAAKEMEGSGAGVEAMLLDWTDQPRLLSATDAFGDDEAIMTDVAMTRDGQYALICDNNAFSGLPNRVAVVELQDDKLRPVQVLQPIPDPVGIVSSPRGDLFLVASGFENALFQIAYRPENPTEPFVLLGELTYNGGKPQLPGAPVSVQGGPHEGMVLVPEVQGIRVLRFDEAGGVEDLGARAAERQGFWKNLGSVGVLPAPSS